MSQDIEQPTEEHMPTPKEQIALAEAAAKEIQNLAREYMPDEAIAAADAAKSQGAEVYCTQVGESWYVYRSLGRFEYQNLLLQQSKQMEQLAKEADNDMSLQIMSKIREQNATVIAAMVYPKIDQMSIKTIGAGTIDTLYNSVMIACGFGQEPVPIKL